MHVSMLLSLVYLLTTDCSSHYILTLVCNDMAKRCIRQLGLIGTSTSCDEFPHRSNKNKAIAAPSIFNIEKRKKL